MRNILKILPYILIVFSSYQTFEFREKGYILKRVYLNVWFENGNFCINNIEDLWSQKKEIIL